MDEHRARVLVGDGTPVSGVAAMNKRAELTLALEAASDGAARSVLLRGLGVLERWDEGAIEGSLALIEQAIAEAAAIDRHDLVAEARLSLSGTLYFGGRADEALAMLEQAEAEATDALVLRIEFQRASIAALEGWNEVAIDAYGRLIERFERSGDRVFLANTLSNRGVIMLDRGDGEGARRDLQRALAMFVELGDERQAAFTEHPLGRVAAMRGDIVGALHHFDECERALRRLNIVPTDVLLMRCEVLLEAGLYAEAEVTAIETERALGETGHNLERSHALYLGGLALLGQSRFADAAAVARNAANVFRELHLDVWEMRAQVLELLSSASSVEEVESLATKLEAAGQWLAAAHAWTAISDRNPAAARAGLQRLPVPIDRAPFEFRFAYLLVHAREQASSGDVTGALATTRAAMELGDRQRWLLGATDLRAAASAQLAAIAELGLSLRLGRRRPWEVLRWSDRCRTASMRAGTAKTTPDTETAELLTRLRAVQLHMRKAEAVEMPVLLRRQGDLQRGLVHAQRLATVRSATRSTGLPRRCRDSLVDVTVVHHHEVGDRLGAVVVRCGKASLVELGRHGEIAAHRAHLGRLLRNLAAGIDEALDAIERHTKDLSRLLLPDPDGRPCVIVPTASLLAFPWSLLPVVAPVPVTVAPNLDHWLRTNVGVHPSTSSIGLVGGIDLTGAGLEVDSIADEWSGHRILQSRPARIAQALEVIERSDVVHVACHGERAARDGRFAQLRLSAGSLTGLEIARLGSVPRVMVFAACDAGVMEPMPGDEASGLAGLLFAAGVDTVIAPVGLLPDNDATTRCMVELHRHLAAGMAPSNALHAAQLAAPAGREQTLARTVNCYGRG